MKEKTLKLIEEKFPCQYKSQTTYLGIEVDYNISNGTMKFNQKEKIQSMITLYNLNEAKYTDTPAAPGTKLVKNSNAENIAKFPFRELVGSLLWIARATRPDILYAVNQVAQQVQAPDETHVKACKRILIYLKTTINQQITYYRTPTLILEAYADADYAGEHELNDKPMRSTSGILILFNNSGLIFCQSQLQSVIAKSTAEAEYIALSNCASIVEGIRNLLAQLSMQQQTSTNIYNDNQAALSMVKRSTSTAKTRHIKIAFHYIKKQYLDGIIKVTYCPTNDMLADILTKALPRSQFRAIRDTTMDLHCEGSIYNNKNNNINNNSNREETYQ